MKALITGGHGFLGKYLVEALAAKGHEATALYRSKEMRSGIRCDLEDVEQVRNLGDYDAIFHLAGQPAVWYSNKHPYEDFRQNIMTTINLLEQYKDSGCVFVYASTCAVYGSGESGEDSPLELDSFYAKSKAYAEMLVQEYAKRFTIKASIARMSFLYGEGMQRNPVFDIMDGIRKGKIELHIAADSQIDFLHAVDAAKGLIALSSHEGIFNLSSGKGTKVSDIVKTVNRNKIPVKYGSRKQHIVLKNDKISEFWQPKHELLSWLST